MGPVPEALLTSGSLSKVTLKTDHHYFTYEAHYYITEICEAISRSSN